MRMVATRPALTPTDLCERIKAVLGDGFPRQVRVVGEVSNLSDRQHWFFSLKDAGAVVSCVCFASDARKSGLRLRDGMQVLAHGRVDFYPQQGRLQLYVNKLEAVGRGALEARLRELVEQLRAEGYMDESRKRPVPAMPACVAVVTSATGAALQDFVRTARHRWPGVALLLYDVLVQGESASGRIAEALRRLSASGGSLGIDAVALIRGGGSIEDLWAFNEREVAEAVYACALPVVVGVGHETDVTVAELVSDRRASTPTQAALLLVPDRSESARHVGHVEARLSGALRRALGEARGRLERVARVLPADRLRRGLVERRKVVAQAEARLGRMLPRRLASERAGLAALSERLGRAQGRWASREREALDRVEARLREAVWRRVGRSRERVEAGARQLAAVSPQRVLERGFSVTLDAGGRALRDAGDVAGGEALTTLLARGRVVSRVEGEVEAEVDAGQRRDSRSGTEKSQAGGPSRGKRRGKRRGGADEGPGLFGG